MIVYQMINAKNGMRSELFEAVSFPEFVKVLLEAVEINSAIKESFVLKVAETGPDGKWIFSTDPLVSVFRFLNHFDEVNTNV